MSGLIPSECEGSTLGSGPRRRGSIPCGGAMVGRIGVLMALEKPDVALRGVGVRIPYLPLIGSMAER